LDDTHPSLLPFSDLTFDTPLVIFLHNARK
jgi:hypothetical protein